MRTGVLITALLAALALPLSADEPVLLVIGVEYSPYPDHYCISGIWASIDSFAWQGQPIPPYEERARDILALSQMGDDPLWWIAHPNWKDWYDPDMQFANLIGLIAATGNTWHPHGIAVQNMTIAPPPWRRQCGIELANRYAQWAPHDRIPAFFLELDFHDRPSIWFEGCGAPYTVAWVRPDWRQLSATGAMEAVFDAVRARRVVGTVGDARFSSIEVVGDRLILELTEPIEHVQLWAGGEEPVATWENTATAAFDLSSLSGTEHFVHWFAYGDSVAGNWEVWSCYRKEVFVSSPIVREGDSFINPYAAGALSELLPIKLAMHQHTSLSDDAAPDLDFTALLADCRALGLDCVLTNDHNPPDFRGQLPTIVTAWDFVWTSAIWAAGPEDTNPSALRALPNPTSAGGTLTVRYELAEPARVSLAVHDALGRLVAKSGEARSGPGQHSLELDLSGQPPGSYFLRLVAGGQTFTTRVTLIDQR